MPLQTILGAVAVSDEGFGGSVWLEEEDEEGAAVGFAGRDKA